METSYHQHFFRNQLGPHRGPYLERYGIRHEFNSNSMTHRTEGNMERKSELRREYRTHVYIRGPSHGRAKWNRALIDARSTHHKLPYARRRSHLQPDYQVVFTTPLHHAIIIVMFTALRLPLVDRTRSSVGRTRAAGRITRHRHHPERHIVQHVPCDGPRSRLMSTSHPRHQHPRGPGFRHRCRA
jgi:hypothetical protein